MDSDLPKDDRPLDHSPARDAAAHGQAALLLVESLIHGLIAQSVISVGEAVAIIEVAADANAEIEVDRAGGEERLTRSKDLLQSISDSLKHDLPTD